MGSLVTTKYKMNLLLLGDPLEDVFIKGRTAPGKTSRFIPDAEELFWITRRGCSDNVFANLHHLLEETNILVRTFDVGDAARLIRYIDQYDWTILEAYDRPVSTDMYSGLQPGWLRWITDSRKALVLSDYNKGACNKQVPEEVAVVLDKSTPFEFLVADSRYGTVHPSWLNYSKLNILHSTLTEVDFPITNSFHWVINTTGAGSVFLYRNHSHEGEPPERVLVKEFPVPNTRPVDTVGAGDTFTAAVAAWLAVYDQGDTQTRLEGAIEFAIQCCQEVITQRYTAIPVSKLIHKE